MRVAAVVVVALVLLAGCSQHMGGRPSTGPGTSTTSPTRTTAAPSPTGTTSATKTVPPQGAPAAGAPIADVVTWIEAAEPADPASYHGATREGTVTKLQDGDVAFTVPGAKTSCMTDSMFAGGDLACLVSHPLNPPPEPSGIYGQWTPGWVEFDGTTLTVGGVHGDPGRFIYGEGAQLPYGKSLKFADYQCRSDQAGVFCVNYAHQSATRISDAGVEPFGCLQKVPSPPDIGEKFSCAP